MSNTAVAGQGRLETQLAAGREVSERELKLFREVREEL